MNAPTQHDAHCRKAGCACQHIHCYRGWVDPPTEGGQGVEAGTTPTKGGGTTPCQWCRADLHRRWLAAQEAKQKGWPLEAVNRTLRGKD